MKDFFEKNNKVFIILFRNLFFTSILIFVLDLFFNIRISHLIGFDFLIFSLFFFSSLWLLFCIRENEEKLKKFLEPLFKFLFLFFLILVTISFLDFEFINKIYEFKIIIDTLKDYVYLLSLFAISSGFFTFYFNRERVEREIEEEEKKEKENEEKRKKEFPEKFKKLNKIPILRNIVKWMYKEGWGYSTLILIIISLGIFLRLQGIFLKSPWFDEGISMSVAQRISEGLGITKVSGVAYPRAYIYQHYLSLYYSLFKSLYGYGVIANTLFYIPTVIIIYKFAKKIVTKNFALLAGVIFALSWYPIAEFRMIRFYEMFVLFFTLSLYLLYLIIEKYLGFKTIDSDSFIKRTLKTTLAFIKKNPVIIFLFLICFLIGYNTHLLMAFLIPSLFVFSFMAFLVTGKNKLLAFASISLLTWVIGNYIRFQGHFSIKSLIFQPEIAWLSTFGRREFTEAWEHFLQRDYYFFLIALIIIIPLSLISKKKILILYLTLLTVSYYSLVALQGTGIIALRYFYPIIPSLAIISVTSFFYLFRLSSKNLLVILLISASLFISIASGITESFSIFNKSSRISENNLYYRDFFNLMRENNINAKNHTIAGDRHIVLMYYLYEGDMPKYEVERNFATIEKTKIGSDDYKYVIGYKDFERIVKERANEDKEIVFMYDGKWHRHLEGREVIFKPRHEIVFELNRMKLLRYE